MDVDQRLCPICNQRNKKQFCWKCIRNGDFTYSTNDSLERFSDKKLKFINLKAAQAVVCAKVAKHLENNAIKEELLFKIAKLEMGNRIFDKMIFEKKKHYESKKDDELRQRREILRQHEAKMSKTNKIGETKNALAKQSVSIDKNVNLYTDQMAKGQIAMREKINSIRHIYPIVKERFGFNDEQDEANDQETSRLLGGCSDDEEGDDLGSRFGAKENSPKDSKGYIKYGIGEAWICLNEDYTSCLAEPNRMDYANNRNLNVRCDEFRKVAALAYLCRMSRLIALVCDIHLPQDIIEKDFYAKDMRKEEVLCKTAKLNANIIVLCIFFNVPYKKIAPKQPYKNMKHLIDKSALGQVINKHMIMSKEFYNEIRAQLEADLKLVDLSPKKENATNPQEEKEFTFVETNLPDLNFENKEEKSGVFSMFSSFLNPYFGKQ